MRLPNIFSLPHARRVAIGVSLALLAGCQSAPPPTTGPLDPGNDVMAELRRISVETRDEMRLLAKTQEALNAPSLTREQHKQKFFQATHVPPGFDKRGDFFFSGDAEKAMRVLASMAGYRFDVKRSVGNKEGVAPTVDVRIKNEPLSEALREIGMQTGALVRIEVHPAARLVSFVYKG